VLTPLELIDQVAALAPPPREHRHRYYDVLAPNAPLRAAVTARAPLPRIHSTGNFPRRPGTAGYVKTSCIDLPHLKRRGLRLGFFNLRRRAEIEGAGHEGV
jgi:hypothetical protein